MKLQNFIRRLILGTNTYAGSHSDFKQVMLSGHFALIGMVAFLLYLIGYFDIHTGLEKAIFIGAFSLLASSIYFHRKRRHVIANYILLGTLNMTTYLFASSESFKTGAFSFYIVCVIGAFSMFNYINRRDAIFFAFFSLGLLALTYLLPFSLLPFRDYPDDFLSTIAVTNSTIALTCCAMAVALLIDLNHFNTQQLDESNKLLVKANEELDRFVYSTSHDLRAPLTSILGLLNITANTHNADELSRYLGMMRDRVHSLDTFIKDITDYSRNNRKEIGMEEVNVKELALAVWEELKFAPEAASIHFEVQVDSAVTVISDRNRLKVILANLISNAIRYHDRRKPQQYVRLRYKQKKDHGFYLKVEDNGQGIAPEYHRKIFDMFYRANESSKGSGLGLYIVKETLAKLSGSISLESNPGSGTSFTVTLPNP